MSEIPAIERELLEAARRRYRPRRRLARRPSPIVWSAAAVAAAALVVAWVAVDAPLPRDTERPARPPAQTATPPYVSTGGYAPQRTLLGVLRRRVRADDDRQVAAVVRGLRKNGPRASDARLLGKAPSGGAFVLVPVERFSVVDPRKTTRAQPLHLLTARDGLCLMRRGNQGGAGICGSTQALMSGAISGAIAGQSYGVVPDEVVAVRATSTSRKVPVRRNFYVYDHIPQQAGWPEWCYADGTCKPTRPLLGSTGA